MLSLRSILKDAACFVLVDKPIKICYTDDTEFENPKTNHEEDKMKLFTVLLAVVAMTLGVAAVFAAAAEEKPAILTEEYLISRSPWVGTLETPFNEIIRLSLSFYRDKNDKFSAKFGNGDEVMFLKIKNSEVTFQNVKRATFVLSLENGTLSGPGYPQYAIKTMTLILYPDPATK